MSGGHHDIGLNQYATTKAHEYRSIICQAPRVIVGKTARQGERSLANAEDDQTRSVTYDQRFKSCDSHRICPFYMRFAGRPMPANIRGCESPSGYRHREWFRGDYQ